MTIPPQRLLQNFPDTTPVRQARRFNTDQGAQFTSDEFTQMLMDHGVEISMDGRGRCHDNIFVERLWWTVKHEWVYLRPAANGRSKATSTWPSRRKSPFQPIIAARSSRSPVP